MVCVIHISKIITSHNQVLYNNIYQLIQTGNLQLLLTLESNWKKIELFFLYFFTIIEIFL